ncbi:MAG: hypothetical protein WC528_04085 [Patescibacteria group bacterium]
MIEEGEKEGHVRPPEGISGDLFGKTIGFYFSLFRWPVLAALVIEIFLIVFDQRLIYIWFVNLIIFVFLALWGRKINQLRLGQILFLGFSAGLVLGLLVAIFKLIWLHKFYLFFNLMFEAVVTALAGLLLCGGTYLLMTKEYKNQNSFSKYLKKNKKGGGENGRK